MVEHRGFLRSAIPHFILCIGIAIIAFPVYLCFVGSTHPQDVIANGDPQVSEAQYPVAPGVASAVAGDLSEVKSPKFDMDQLADSAEAQDLLKELGMSSG